MLGTFVMIAAGHSASEIDSSFFKDMGFPVTPGVINPSFVEHDVQGSDYKQVILHRLEDWSKSCEKSDVPGFESLWATGSSPVFSESVLSLSASAVGISPELAEAAFGIERKTNVNTAHIDRPSPRIDPDLHAHDDQVNMFAEITQSSYADYLVYQSDLGIAGYSRYIGFTA